MADFEHLRSEILREQVFLGFKVLGPPRVVGREPYDVAAKANVCGFRHRPNRSTLRLISSVGLLLSKYVREVFDCC